MNIMSYSCTLGFKFIELEPGDMFDFKGRVYIKTIEHSESNAQATFDGDTIWMSADACVGKINTIQLIAKGGDLC